MEIKKDIKNNLMKRRELEIVLESDKNPSFSEISKLLAQDLKAEEESIMVENIRGAFGKKDFIIKASIYDTKELKDEAFKRLTKTKKVVAPVAQ